MFLAFLFMAVVLLQHAFIYAELRALKKRGEAIPYREIAVTYFINGCGLVFNYVLVMHLYEKIGSNIHQLSPLRINPAAWYWFLILFFLTEFVYYWFHRLAHIIRWFWAEHRIHHTPEHFNFTVGYRLSPLLGLTGDFIFRLPLYLLVPPVYVLGFLLFNNFYQFFVHTTCFSKAPAWFEYVFNTPSHHRVHHATNSEYLDKNFGGILIIFDRWFGTFAEEKPDTTLNFGVLNRQSTLNPLKEVFGEFGSMFADAWRLPRFSQRWRALFGRPGEPL